ncbi:unnamed protein product [Paramecium sonneborni]|uniref:Uncharacterized protein n=1 Tax=Paramecium sonneborni TaxID=65129 RepID=A0A8S1R771_9CILI|nr:unnamed protein product [Paramecium sonneborni]
MKIKKQFISKIRILAIKDLSLQIKNLCVEFLGSDFQQTQQKFLLFRFHKDKEEPRIQQKNQILLFWIVKTIDEVGSTINLRLINQVQKGCQQILHQIREQIKDASQKPEVLANQEQINYLQWIGEYGPNNKKQGYWRALWKGQHIPGVGREYSIDGKKVGIWKDLFKNYWTEAQVYEIGKYKNDMRQGSWQQFYNYKKMQYDSYQLNQRRRRIQLPQIEMVRIIGMFFYNTQVIYDGEYNIKGRKIGRWNIIAWEQLISQFLIVEDLMVKERMSLKLGDGQNCGRISNILSSYLSRRIQQERDKARPMGYIIRQIINWWRIICKESGTLFQDWNVDKAQIIYEGECNMKGMKIGRQNISKNINKG